jgi:hypothetical protein
VGQSARVEDHSRENQRAVNRHLRCRGDWANYVHYLGQCGLDLGRHPDRIVLRYRGGRFCGIVVSSLVLPQPLSAHGCLLHIEFAIA